MDIPIRKEAKVALTNSIAEDARLLNMKGVEFFDIERPPVEPFTKVYPPIVAKKIKHAPAAEGDMKAAESLADFLVRGGISAWEATDELDLEAALENAKLLDQISRENILRVRTLLNSQINGTNQTHVTEALYILDCISDYINRQEDGRSAIFKEFSKECGMPSTYSGYESGVKKFNYEEPKDAENRDEPVDC